jgi:hypothetical protein
MKLNPVKASVKSARSASRCHYQTATGRRCCSLAIGPVSRLCQRHADALERLDKIDHSAILTRFSRGFQTVEGINFALGDLYVLLAQGRISPRRAAVLTHMAALMLRTLPVMHRNFGKYRYRLIGATRPPEQDHDPDPSDLEEDDEAHGHNYEDESAESADSNDDVNEVTSFRAQREISLPVEAQASANVVEAKEDLPRGLTPLPATRADFLAAVDQAAASEAAKEKERPRAAPSHIPEEVEK